MNKIKISTKYNKTAKLLVIFIVVFTTLNFQSCAELDPDPLEFNLPPEVFSNLDEMDKGISGIYSKIVNASRWTTFYAPAWAGDDMTTWASGNKADFREFDQRNVQASNSRLLSNWNAILDVINTTNSVLDRSKGLENLAVDQDLLNRYIGETHFIRGIMFYQLARVHGRIPLPLTTIPDPNISRATQLEVFQQIEADLLEAEKRLPNVYPSLKEGASRPNKGSAKSILARLYMDWAGFPLKDNSKYTDAANIAKTVIDNASTYKFGLVDDLENLWTVAGRFNNESVFTLTYCNSCGDDRIANWKYGIVGLNDSAGGWSETFGEIKFYEDFPTGPRKEATYRMDLDWRNFSSAKDQKSPIFKKIAGPKGDLPNSFITNRNDFFMRYAEVLLIYAEASARSGAVTADSWEALNKIRRRASGLPFATPDATVDLSSGDLAELAFTERKWEFAGEYLRWYDLMRLERVQEVLGNRTPSGTIAEHNQIAGSLSTDNYFSPIPAEALNNNPNLGN
ncbi:hypothetical protein BTO15_18100 [Polaribacter sejongensis]|uniref:RagB/SusD family nutrient uptake outer membrane protein n=1 Tax=Polaribacter sejongensis TaxID=985043 RepID=A0ABN5FAR1_9FLAO|nr:MULTISPECIES: RagB/SusD family nutrient uptake outer membrane protein [Polaribacter]AUC23890.1 hypothetical protein BTO15_18100 [Polaribacter sejongensis]